MSSVVEAILRLTAKDDTAKGLASAKRTTEKFRQDEIAGWGKLKTAAAEALGAFIGGEFLRRAYTGWAEMDRKVRVLTFSLEGAEKNVREVKKALEDMAATGVASVDELAASADILDDRLNLNLDSVKELNRKMADAANVLGIKPAEMAEAFTNAVKSLDIPAKDFDKLIADMVIGAQRGNLKMQDLIGRFPKLAELAGQVGYKGEKGFQRLLTIMSVLKTESNLSTRAFSTGMEQAFELIMGKTDELDKKLGLIPGTLAQALTEAKAKGEDPLTALATMVHNRAQELGKSVGAIVPGTLGILLEGMDKAQKKGSFESFFRSLGNSVETYSDQVTAVRKDNETQVKAMAATWIQLTDHIGETVAALSALLGKMASGGDEKVTVLTLARDRLQDVANAIALINTGMDAIINKFPTLGGVLGKLPQMIPGIGPFLHSGPIIPAPEDLFGGGKKKPGYTPAPGETWPGKPLDDPLLKKQSYTGEQNLNESRKQTQLLQRIAYGRGGGGAGPPGAYGGGLQQASWSPGSIGGGMYSSGARGYGGGGGGGGGGYSDSEAEPVGGYTGEFGGGGGGGSQGGASAPSWGSGVGSSGAAPPSAHSSGGASGAAAGRAAGGAAARVAGGIGRVGRRAAGNRGAALGPAPHYGRPSPAHGGDFRGGGGSFGGGGATSSVVAPAAAAAAGGGAIPVGNFSQMAPHIMNRLMSRYGLTKEQAAGILGNLGHESMGFKAFHELGKAEGKGGYGWAQWTGGRRVKFLNFAKEQGLNPRSNEASMRFLEKELDESVQNRGDASIRTKGGGRLGAIPAVKGQTSAYGSMKAYEATFERAGVKGYKSRARYTEQAQRAYAEHGADSAAPAPSSGHPPGGLHPKPVTQEVNVKYNRGPSSKVWAKQDLRREVNRETRQARYHAHSDISA